MEFVALSRVVKEKSNMELKKGERERKRKDQTKPDLTRTDKKHFFCYAYQTEETGGRGKNLSRRKEDFTATVGLR